MSKRPTLLRSLTSITLALLLLGAAGCNHNGLRNLGDSGTVAVAGPDGGGADAGAPPKAPMLKLLVGGLGGPGDVDGIATAARFSHPAALFLDGQGNLFVADRFNHTI